MTFFDLFDEFERATAPANSSDVFAELEQRLDAICHSLGIHEKQVAALEIRGAIPTWRLVLLVKAYRAFTGCDLKTAMEAVEIATGGAYPTFNTLVAKLDAVLAKVEAGR